MKEEVCACARIGLRGGGKNNERVIIYDWVRLIAMIYVVIGHSAYLSVQSLYGSISYSVPDNISTAYDSGFLQFCRSLPGWIYGFHMPLFFILSGAVLALKSGGGFDGFVKSKIKRLLIPYFVYSWLFTVPVKYLGGFYSGDSMLWAMQGILTGQEGSHLWFLPALFWCMTGFVILRKVIAKWTNSVYLLLFAAGTAQLMCSYIPFDVLCMKQGIGYIFWFALGYVFEAERKRNSEWMFRETVIAFAVVTGIEILNWKYMVLPSFFLILCGSFHTYLLADICSRRLKRLTNRNEWKMVIRNLFYVYLFHDPLEYVVVKIFMDADLLSSAFGCYLYTFSRTVLIFTLSILLGSIVGKGKEILGHCFRMDFQGASERKTKESENE